MFRLGVDLGGTKTECIVLDEDNRELFRKRIPTEGHRGYEHLLNAIHGLYKDMCAQIDGAAHTLGIGTPGAISVKTGFLKNTSVRCLIGKPFREDLAARLGHDLVMENDANCFALAEACCGAAMGKALAFGVIMGTGCGGGIVYNGKVIDGLQRIAGEWGHMSIDPRGPVCYCGNPGCVEQFISGSGLERRWQAEHGEARALRRIVEDYRGGGAAATAFMQQFFEDFGRAAANLINVLDPDVIVLGGGVSNIDEIYTEGVARVGRYVFGDEMETPIVKHKLGDSAGVIGAALIGI